MKYRNKFYTPKSQLKKIYIEIPLDLKLNQNNWIKTPTVDFKFTDFDKFHQQYFKFYDFFDIDFYNYIFNFILKNALSFEEFPEII